MNRKTFSRNETLLPGLERPSSGTPRPLARDARAGVSQGTSITDLTISLKQSYRKARDFNFYLGAVQEKSKIA
jgi:hypothetical protein